jgi:hypothetical protein
MSNGWSMSALPPEADSRPQSQNVCFVPNQTLMPRYRIDLTPSSVIATVVPVGDQKGTRCVGSKATPTMPWLPPEL